MLRAERQSGLGLNKAHKDVVGKGILMVLRFWVIVDWSVRERTLSAEQNQS